MEQKIRCQSCGMPMVDGFFGTNTNGSRAEDYCKFCFQDGTFVQPELVMNDMISMSVDNMVSELDMQKEEAEQLANDFIPKLKRWATKN